MEASRRESGQVLPLVAAAIALAGLLALGVAHVGVRAIGRARAQAAADAAALAGVTGGRVSAETLAAANGSAVVAFDEVTGGVRVEVVDKGGEHAVAQAEAVLSAGDDVRLAAAMRAVLARAAQVVGAAVTVVSVDPGGLVVQVAPDQVAVLTGRGAEDGLCPVGDRPGWFEICPP